MRPRLPVSLVAGLALTTLFVLAALLSLIWTPHAVESLNIAARLQPPSGTPSPIPMPTATMATAIEVRAPTISIDSMSRPK